MWYCIFTFHVSATRFVCVNILSFQVEVLFFGNAINVLCLCHWWCYTTASDGSSVGAGVPISDGDGDVHPGDADDNNGDWVMVAVGVVVMVLLLMRLMVMVMM